MITPFYADKAKANVRLFAIAVNVRICSGCVGL